MKIIEEGFCMSIEGKSVEGGRVEIDFDKRVSALSHVEDVLLKRNVRTCVIKVGDAQSLLHWHAVAHIRKQRQLAFLLD